MYNLINEYTAHVFHAMLCELRRDEEGIMRADRALKKIERDREKRARAIFWDNQRLVRNSDMHAAEEKGRIEGRTEGRIEGRQEGRMAGQEEIARNMIARGYKLEEIQAITGLSSEGIDKLR
jgi:predicted transposase/invertase (TIGR01784 family)